MAGKHFGGKKIALSCTVIEKRKCFYLLRSNSRWPPKISGKQFLDTFASSLCRNPVCQKFRRNRSISHRYQDKCVFAFYAEIQDGCQKLRENDFREKSLVDSADILWIKNFVKIALSLSLSRCF